MYDTEYLLEVKIRRADGDWPSQWSDGSGYNNTQNGGVYYTLRALKAQKTRTAKWNNNRGREVQFRVFQRQVIRTPWEEVESD